MMRNRTENGTDENRDTSARLSSMAWFFEQMHKSDVFVIYDDVQYDKESWRNRNRIKTANGVQWLTVPVIVKFDAHPLITEVMIDNKKNWAKASNFYTTKLFKDSVL